MNKEVARLRKIIFRSMMVAVFSMITCFAFSFEHTMPPQGDFIENFDEDGDGSVSQEEFPGPDEHFAELDTDGSGYIESDEVPEGPPPHGSNEDMIAHLDTDGDGKISQEEFPGPDEHFAELDQDDSGYIESDEVSEGPPPHGSIEDLFENLDTDGDGKISANEFNGPEDLFEKLDENGDGYLTEDEMPQGPPPENR